MNEEQYILNENAERNKRLFKWTIVKLLILAIILIIEILLILLILNKIFKDKDIKDMKFMGDIIDGNVGVNYYAYSPYSTEYSKVKGLIKLPDSININNGKRNAYISFGILGINGSINIGLINSGTGWIPFYYFNRIEEMFCYHEYCSNEETDFIEIEIEVTQEKKILVYFILRNSNLFELNSLNFEINASDFLEYENEKVKVRFSRFASLVPLKEDDQNDGIFTKLIIVKYNKTESWGISGNNTEFSWLIP